jgi:hypothetical protein
MAVRVRRLHGCEEDGPVVEKYSSRSARCPEAERVEYILGSTRAGPESGQRSLAHCAVDFNLAAFPTLRAEEGGSRSTARDRSGPPATVLMPADGALHPVLDRGAVLTDDHRALTCYRPSSNNRRGVRTTLPTHRRWRAARGRRCRLGSGRGRDSSFRSLENGDSRRCAPRLTLGCKGDGVGRLGNPAW